MDPFIATFGAFICTVAGFFLKWIWDWGTQRVEEARKEKEQTLKERLDIIGGEIKSRISSLEFRHRELETTISTLGESFTEFRKEVKFALQTQRDAAHKLYDGVKEIIKRADDRYEKMHGEVKEMKEQVVKLYDWKKK